MTEYPKGVKIAYAGKGCPVLPETPVRVWFANGIQYFNPVRADTCHWRLGRSGHTITHFMICEGGAAHNDSRILETAISELRKQEAKGREKYGADLSHFEGSPLEMLRHALSEKADDMCYTIRAIEIVEGMERRTAELEAENQRLRNALIQIDCEPIDARLGVSGNMERLSEIARAALNSDSGQ